MLFDQFRKDAKGTQAVGTDAFLYGVEFVEIVFDAVNRHNGWWRTQRRLSVMKWLTALQILVCLIIPMVLNSVYTERFGVVKISKQNALPIIYGNIFLYTEGDTP